MKKSNKSIQGEFDFQEQECLDHKKRRLKADQVKALEQSFEAENKLEPERKVQLAIELGLDPRQVAIWFQNRRARWKTKQLERDYFSLQSNYDELKRSYDTVKLHNETLLRQIGDTKARVVRGGVAVSSEEDEGGAINISLNNYEPSFYSNLNVVSTDSVTSDVQSEGIGAPNGVVSSNEMLRNDDDDSDLAIGPAADTYSFFVDEEPAPAFNWYCPHPWT